jgi:hypothetical protein
MRSLLAHVFASCGATLAKTPFAFELACDWTDDYLKKKLDG